MQEHRIIIYIEGLNLPQFEWMLNDFFVWKKSPLYPLYVYRDLHHEYIGDEKEAIRTKGQVEVKVTFTNFQVVEASKNEKIFQVPIASMHFQRYISQFVVFIEGIEGEEKNWHKVETIVRAIISQAEFLNFKIQRTEPKNFLPKSSLPAWEQIEDKGSNREILKLWWDGLKNSEIAPRVGIQPVSVTNRLSELRSEYGEAIVPTAEQIRKIRRSNTDDSV